MVGVTVAENRERGHYVDTAACDRWPLERVDDDRAEWYDLEYIQDVGGEHAGVIATADEVAEAKSCDETYDGRAGRWWIRRETTSGSSRPTAGTSSLSSSATTSR